MHDLICCHRTLHTVVPIYRLGNEGWVAGVSWWWWFTQLVVEVKPGWATGSVDGVVPHLLLTITGTWGQEETLFSWREQRGNLFK